MGPTRKPRSLNKRYANEDSPSKAESGVKSHSRKRKLSDMLGPRWTTEELTRYYDAYRKHGKDWKKVSGAVKNRSSEMAEALYTMNRAYLSLPHGTASAAGLIAMMTDHYSNLAGSDSDQNSDDGAGSSKKAEKHFRGKVQPTPSKATDEQFVTQSQTGTSNYGCLPLLTKKHSKGSRPCPVGKRTPRFPVSFSHENNSRERYFSPAKKALQLKADANDDEVAHEIAIALAEASQRGGSPQISLTPSRRVDRVMSSPYNHAQKKYSLAEIANTKNLNSDMDEEDLGGSTDADTGGLSGYKPTMVESSNVEMARKPEGHKLEDDKNSENHLGDDKKECSETDEGQRLSATTNKTDVEVTDDKVSKSSMQSQRTKSKKILSERDETAAFDALQTLADLSLMMPAENEDDLRMPFKNEVHNYIDESAPLQAAHVNQQKEKRRYVRVRKKGISSSQIASSKQSKPGKDSVFDVIHAPEENQDLGKLMTKTRKKQLSKIQNPEVQPNMHLNDSPVVEMEDTGKKLMAKSKKFTQTSSPNLMKKSENSSSADLRKEGSDSAQSAVQVTLSNEVNLTPEVTTRRKMDLKQSPVLNELHDQSNVQLPLLNERVLHLKEKLSNCLLNPRLRRWCTYEWFYSAIDFPWFEKREFVEYLEHVGLGHVSKLTRAEWGVIRSSLGKPRRFSEQFLKEEKEKLNQYRDSVRKHYTELHEGVREGLPTDLAKPLSVGQRVIAIHPNTRDIHDGSVLTVDHSRCRVQFDCHEIGVEFVLDIDCMPVNPSENMPTSHGRLSNAVAFFENFYELKLNGQAKEFRKLCPGDYVDSSDGIPQLFQLTTDPACLMKQTKVVSLNTNVQTGIGSAENASYQQTPYFGPGTLAQIQAKEADVKALVDLTRSLDKKEAVVMELRRMNDDVLENMRDCDNSLKDSEPFKKQYAALLVQLNEVNEQVSFALQRLRQRNTYHGNNPLAWIRPISSSADVSGEFNSSDHAGCEAHESGSHANDIIDSSKGKARAMVAAAIRALSSLKSKEDTSGKIEETVDYLNERLLAEDSTMPLPPDHKPITPSGMEAQVPSELISKCVATLIMIQKCTERQLPPSDMAQILDSAMTSLQPRCPQNLPIYSEIQKCMGIIRNQIMAKIPT